MRKDILYLDPWNIRNYYEQLYANVSQEMNNIQPTLTLIEMDNLNRSL